MDRRRFLGTGIVGLAGVALTADPFQQVFAQESGPLKIGVIGYGSRGSGVAGLIKDIPGITLVAYSDIMERQLNAAKALFPDALGYKDYRKLLDNAIVDAVIIALPEHLHFPVASEALQRGKHVYLEKTMTHTAEQADLLVELASRYPKSVVQVGHQYRYYNLYHKVLDVINGDFIGEVKQYECQYHRNSNWRRPVSDPSLERQINWRMYKEYSGGLMTELCAHQVDILNWFTGGHPLSVAAVGGIDYWKDGRETFDNIRAIFTYPNGVKANVSAILTNSFNGYSIRILGTKGTIEIQRNKAFAYSEQLNAKPMTVDGVTGATAESWGQGKPMELEFRNQDEQNRDPTAYALMDFARCISEKRTPFSNVETGRNTAKAVLLANMAAESETIQHWD